MADCIIRVPLRRVFFFARSDHFAGEILDDEEGEGYMVPFHRIREVHKEAC